MAPRAASSSSGLSSTIDRMRAPAGVAPGSRVVTTTRPYPCSVSARRCIWVDLPAPSPPSKTMKRPMPGSGRPAAAISGSSSSESRSVRPRKDAMTSANSGTPGLSSICFSAAMPATVPNTPAASSRGRVVEMVNPKMSRDPPRPTRKLDNEIVSSRVTCVPVWMNANTRPRTSSVTSLPSSVVPDRNAIPAPMPTHSAPITPMSRCHANASAVTASAAQMIDRPNHRRRDNPPTIFGPATMPIPRPTKMLPNRM